MPDAGRVVEVFGAEEGSGYLIGPRLVLTARHVVCVQAGHPAPAIIQVRVLRDYLGGLPKDRTTAPRARQIWPPEASSDDTLDFALLVIDDPDYPSDRPIYWSELPTWGETRVDALGFPNSASFTNAYLQHVGLPPFREIDTRAIRGLVTPGSGLKSQGAYDVGTFDIILRAEDQPTGSADDWGGMSGAAVFEGPNLVGVVQKANETRSFHRLKALPITRLFRRDDVIEAIRTAGLTPPLQRRRSDDYDILGAEAFTASSRVFQAASAQPFYGRSQDLHDLDDCLTRQDRGVILLRGEAGLGKSRLAARWANHCAITADTVVLWHAFSVREPAAGDRMSMVKNLLRQAAASLGPEVLGSDKPGDAALWGDRLAVLLGTDQPEDFRLIVALDALDEAAERIEPWATPLGRGVFILATCRAEAGEDPVVLRAWRDRATKADILALYHTLPPLDAAAIALWLAAATGREIKQTDSLVVQTVRASEGNPLFASILIPDAIEALQANAEDPFPVSFRDYALEQLNGLRDRLAAQERHWGWGKILKLFAVLSVARAPLPAGVFRDLVSPHSLGDLDQRAERWLWRHADGGMVSFTHPRLAAVFRSVLPQFEGDEPDIATAEEQLVEACDKEWRGSGQKSLRAYALTWLPAHLIELGRVQEAAALLSDGPFLRRKLDLLGINAILADYELLNRETETRQPASIRSHPHFPTISDLQLLGDALRLSSHLLATATQLLASQLVGRLMSANSSNIKELLTALRLEEEVWIETAAQSLAPAGSPLLRTMVSPSGSVCGLRLGSDERYALSRSGRGELELWDLISGNVIIAPTQVEKSAVAYVVGADPTQSLEEWELGEQKVGPSYIQGKKGSSVTTSNGKFALSASKSSLCLWDFATGNMIKRIRIRGSADPALAVTEDGEWGLHASVDASGTSDVYTLTRWNLTTERKVGTTTGATDIGDLVGLTAGGKRAVFIWSGGEFFSPHGLTLLDLETGISVRTKDSHASPIFSLALDQDRGRAVTGSYDRTVKLWDLDEGALIRTFEGHSDGIWSIALPSNGRRAISASFDGTIRIWDLERDPIDVLERHPHRVMSVSMICNGQSAVTGSWDNTLKLWNLSTCQVIRTITGPHNQGAGNQRFVVAQGGRCAVSKDQNGVVTIFDLEAGATAQHRLQHADHPSFGMVGITPDGKRGLLNGMFYNEARQGHERLRLLELDNDKIRTLRDEAGACLAMTSDGRYALLGVREGIMTVCIEDWREIKKFKNFPWPNNREAIFTPDLSKALIVNLKEELVVFDLNLDKTVQALQGTCRGIRALAITEDGRYGVSTAPDYILRLWNLDNGSEIAAFGGDGEILACAISPDGETIVAGETSGQVHILKVVKSRSV